MGALLGCTEWSTSRLLARQLVRRVHVCDFYDQLAPKYHLIFDDWERSIERQGEQLASIIRAEWSEFHSVLDVSCGVGTQAIALATKGFLVRGSDLSRSAVERAKCEAAKRNLAIAFSVCDMREAFAHHGGGFDLVVSCDNSVPHLLSDVWDAGRRRSRYYAISIDNLIELMKRAGFSRVRRIDDVFYQPVLVGSI